MPMLMSSSRRLTNTSSSFDSEDDDSDCDQDSFSSRGGSSGKKYINKGRWTKEEVGGAMFYLRLPPCEIVVQCTKKWSLLTTAGCPRKVVHFEGGLNHRGLRSIT